MEIPIDRPGYILKFYGLNPDDYYYIKKDADDYFYMNKETGHRIYLRR